MDNKCEFFTEKGTMCPQVVAPGKTLSTEQQAKLLAIVQRPPRDKAIDSDRPDLRSGRPSFRCADEAATAFVFYDSKDIPRGVVTLTTSCLRWRFQPSIPGTWEGFAGLFEEERSTIRSLCNQLDLDGCRTKTAADKPFWQSSHVKTRRLLPLVLKEAPAIDLSKPLSATTSAERLALCVWAWRGIQTAGLALVSRRDTMATGIEFEIGESMSMRVLSIDQCVQGFPVDCSETAAHGLNSLRAVFLGIAEGRTVPPSVCPFGIKTVP